MDQTLKEKLEQLQREYAIKKRKLKKIKRASSAKAHVKMKLLEQEGLTSHKDTVRVKDEIASLDKSSSPVDITTPNDASTSFPTTSTSGYHKVCVQGNPENTLIQNKTEMIKVEANPASVRICDDNSSHTSRSSAINSKQTSCKKESDNSLKHQQHTKLSKYKNRKIVTILSSSVTDSRKSDLNSCSTGNQPTDSDGEITSVEDSQISEDMNGNVVTAKPSSNTETDVHAMIYERRPELAKSATANASNMNELYNQGASDDKNTQGTVQNLSKMGLKTDSKDTPKADNIETDQWPSAKLCPTPTGVGHSFALSHQDCFDKASSSVPEVTVQEKLADTESFQCSSTYSDDLFDDDNSLKRRTRKARRRSVNSEKRRQSTRLAEQSSQGSQSSTSQNLDLRKNKSLVLSGNTSRKVNKKVIISSVFQCLVDEVKRKKDKEFEIPDELKELKTDDEETPSEAVAVRLSKENCEQLKDLGLGSPIPSGQSDHTGSFSPDLDNLTITDCHEVDLEDTVKDSISETISTSTSPRVSHTTGTTRSDPVAGTSSHQSEQEAFYETGLPKPKLLLADTDELLNQSEDLVDSGCMSPPLFDSQPVVTALNEPDIREEELDVNEPAISELTIQTNVNERTKDDCQTERCVEDNKEGDSTETNNDDSTEEINFEQIACFQVPASDQLLGMETIVAVRCGKPVVYITCLCTTALKLYSCVDDVWTCIASEAHSSPIRKKAVFRLYGWPGLASVELVLVLSRADTTTLTHYTYTNFSNRHAVIDTVTSKGVCSCRLTDHQLIVSQWSGKKTTLTKHRLDTTAERWSQFDLETCDKKIVTMTTVPQSEMAVAGFTGQGILHIWNHDCGFLLSTVDLSDICPRDFICPEILQEQGYLFLPLLTRKRSLEERGTIVVVNPQLNTSEALTSIQAGDQSWNGCSKAAVLHDDLLVAMDTSGTLSVLDLHSGGRLASVDIAGVTCFTANNDTLYLGHKQCVHVFCYSSDLKT